MVREESTPTFKISTHQTPHQILIAILSSTSIPITLTHLIIFPAFMRLLLSMDNVTWMDESMAGRTTLVIVEHVCFCAEGLDNVDTGTLVTLMVMSVVSHNGARLW